MLFFNQIVNTIINFKESENNIIIEKLRENRIDFLKALAIMSVILFHYYPRIFSNGFLGIDVFFILSGYLIHTKLLNDRDHFFENRFRRIFPPFIILIAITIVLGYVYLAPNEFLQLMKQSNFSVIFMSDLNYGLNLDYFGFANTSILLHTWSLGVEVKFYLFWFFITAIAITTNSKVQVLARNLLLISIVLNLIFRDDAINYYLFTSRLFEFLVGVMASERNLVNQKGVKNRRVKIMPLISTIGLLVILFQPLIPLIYANQLIVRFFLVLLVCILVSSLLSNQIMMPSIANSKILILLGRISYSLYLYHYPILYFKRLIYPEFNPLVEVSSVCISLLCAYFSNKIFEIGFKKVSTKLLIIFSVSSLLLFFMLSYLTQSTNGFVNRVPDFNKNYTQSYESMPKFKYELCWLSMEVVPSSKDCSWGGDVMLLGDSYAGTLAAGLNNQDLEKYGFSVYAKSSCLPLVVGQSIDCDTFNEFILKRMKMLTPKTIIISAKWQMYYEENPQIFNEFFKLLLSFDGSSKILLIGSPPDWTAPLPSIIAPKIRILKPTFSKIKDSSNDAVINTEKIIRQKLSNGSNVSFFSILDEYCSENGCTPVTESGRALLSFDQGHFTPIFAQEILSKLLAMKLFIR